MQFTNIIVYKTVKGLNQESFEKVEFDRRLFNCENRRIETHQSPITSLHSQ